MNAAAAKALDCFSMRDCDDGMTTSTPSIDNQRCYNAPYLRGHTHELLLPEGVSLPSQLINFD